MMTFKIISTTDGKFIGETVTAERVAGPGDDLTHKDVTFEIVGMKQSGPYITFYCPNYAAIVKILSYGD
jgi:hypothetical protein